MEAMEKKTEIRTVGIMGAGAVGAYFLWGMRNLPCGTLCLIARGERKERLQKEGMIINGERFLYPVKTPEEAAGVDLLLITTKYGALPGLLEDIKTVVKPQTAVLSLLNGVDSEEIIGEAIGEEHMLYSLMRISSERNGNIIFFDPKETRGMWFGEKGIHQITPRAQAVLDLFAQTDCRCTWKEDIMAELWYKYAINISHNLPQAVLGVGLGCYEDSEHMSFLARKLWGGGGCQRNCHKRLHSSLLQQKECTSVHPAGSAGKKAYRDRHVCRSHDTDGEGSGNSRAILRVYISCHQGAGGKERREI